MWGQRKGHQVSESGEKPKGIYFHIHQLLITWFSIKTAHFWCTYFLLQLQSLHFNYSSSLTSNMSIPTSHLFTLFFLPSHSFMATAILQPPLWLDSACHVFFRELNISVRTTVPEKFILMWKSWLPGKLVMATVLQQFIMWPAAIAIVSQGDKVLLVQLGNRRMGWFNWRVNRNRSTSGEHEIKKQNTE